MPKKQGTSLREVNLCYRTSETLHDWKCQVPARGVRRGRERVCTKESQPFLWDALYLACRRWESGDIMHGQGEGGALLKRNYTLPTQTALPLRNQNASCHLHTGSPTTGWRWEDLSCGKLTRLTEKTINTTGCENPRPSPSTTHLWWSPLVHTSHYKSRGST